MSRIQDFLCIWVTKRFLLIRQLELGELCRNKFLFGEDEPEIRYTFMLWAYRSIETSKKIWIFDFYQPQSCILRYRINFLPSSSTIQPCSYLTWSIQKRIFVPLIKLMDLCDLHQLLWRYDMYQSGEWQENKFKSSVVSSAKTHSVSTLNSASAMTMTTVEIWVGKKWRLNRATSSSSWILFPLSYMHRTYRDVTQCIYVVDC